jgi:hypothetical protein
MQNTGTIYGYARVSTEAQDLTSQVGQLRAAGCAALLRENLTGTNAERPQLKRLMKALAPGDVVITPAVDRLSGDTTDLLVIARDIQRAGAGPRRRPGQGGEIRAQADPDSAPTAGGTPAPRRRGNTAERGPQLQRQPGDDFTA